MGSVEVDGTPTLARRSTLARGTSVAECCGMRTHFSSAANGSTSATPPVARLGYHDAVSDFKRRLIEVTLRQAQGNRTHAARALGLQRTYLLRLIRELGVAAPPPPPRGRPTGLRAG
jgi:DNA-binding NtrC family response regulator